MNTQNTARDLNLETKIKNVEAEGDPIIREIEVRKKKRLMIRKNLLLLKKPVQREEP